MATETKNAHTPGPWHFDFADWVIRDQDERRIAQVQYAYQEDHFHANALLMSLAPEMLATLKDISDRDPVGETCSHECTCIGCIARKAISKAEGK